MNTRIGLTAHRFRSSSAWRPIASIAVVMMLANSVLANSGVLVGHGENQHGELNAPIPTLVRSPRLLATGIKQVLATPWSSYLLDQNNGLRASGSSPASTWFSDTSSVFYEFTPVVGVAVDFSADYNSLTWVDTFGILRGWGRNPVGQLGYGNPDPVLTTTELATGVAAVKASSVNTVWLKTDGTLWGVGSNFGNPFGTPTEDQPTVPVQIASDVAQIFKSGGTSLFIKKDGSLWGCGLNFWGQLGLGHQLNQNTPVKLTENVVSASTIGGRSVYITADGTLWGMGYCQNGELGPNAAHPQLMPVSIATNVASVSTSLFGTLFVDRDGMAWGFGPNNSGQLGLGDTLDRAAPTAIVSGVAAASLSDSHALLLKTDGTAWGMGNGSTGLLGPQTSVFANEPQRSVSRVHSIASNQLTTFFIRDDLRLWAVGSNTRNVRGLATSTSYSDHANLVATAVTKVATSGDHALFIKSDGSLWFVGSRDSGRFGLPFTPQVEEPVQIATAAAEVAARNGNSFYVDSSGVLWGSGENAHYQLGLGHTNMVHTFTAIATDVARVVAGQTHTLFIKKDGSLWGMGRSGAGELGSGTGTEAPTPVFIAHNTTSAACGWSNSYYLTSDGQLWGLGSNVNQQLGQGGEVFRNTSPRKIASGARHVAAGTAHVLWIDTEGRLWGQGRAAFGELSIPIVDMVGSPRLLANQVTTVTATNNGTLYSQVPETYLANLSTRVKISDTGEGVLTAGFVISGTEPLTVLVRAVGPGLAPFIGPGTMPDPSLQIFNSSGTLITSNDDWSSDNASEISSVSAELGAFALTEGSADSALLVSLPPGPYTAKIERGPHPGGVVLLEVYNRTPRSWRSRLVNLSVRTDAGAGDDTLTAGFVVEGKQDAALLVRAIGPTLGDFGVPGYLADPRLAVLGNSTTIAVNDDWAGDTTILTNASDVGAFALPAASRDAASMVEIAPGAYTAQVLTKSNATGNALIEVYQVDN